MRHRWMVIGASLISLGWIAPAQARGVCDRTPQVRDLLMERVGVKDCSAVTAEQLATVEELNLEQSGLVSLRAHDFRGLTHMRWLLLGHNQLRELPQGIFDNLTRLEILWLGGNHLQALPHGIFDRLIHLEELLLPENELQALPHGIFDGLTQLKQLWLRNNQLRELPHGIFDRLTRLEELLLPENELTALPAGVFDDLTRLEFLSLSVNQLRELPHGIFDRLTRLEVLGVGGNQLQELPQGIFDDLTRLESLGLDGNQLRELPQGIFDRLTRLLSLQLHDNELTALPAGVFDNLLGTLGKRKEDVIYIGGGPIGLRVDSSLKAGLGFVRTAKRVIEGARVRVGVSLSRALPVAVRIPYDLGVSGEVDGVTALSPDPERGVLFRAGETEQSITFTVGTVPEGSGEGRVVLTLGALDLDEVGLRRSDGTGPDAPYLNPRTLVWRGGALVHTVTVSATAPEEEDEPYCLSLWGGTSCAPVATLTPVVAGPVGEGLARAEVVITHRDPDVTGCAVAVLFHRGAAPAPVVAFNDLYLEGNRYSSKIPRGGAGIVTLTAPESGEAAEGAVTVFTQSPCGADSLRIQGRVMIESRGDGEIEEMYALAGQRSEEWLGDGGCWRVTGVFGEGRGLKWSMTGAEPGQAAPAGTRLQFAVLDAEGNYRGFLPGLGISGAHQVWSPGALDGLATVEMCLDVPGERDFRLAATVLGARAGGARVQYAPERGFRDPDPVEVSGSGR